MSYEYEKIILKSGTRLILVPDSSKQVVTTLILFGVGSRFENEEEAGISHVIEHMHYKGTKKRPTAVEIAEFVENIGGEHNAFTSKEYTGYYTKVAAKHLEKSIDFICDLVTNPLFDSDELEKEKNVILQEVDMYQDLPMELAGSNFERVLFGGNHLGRDVIGYKNSIKSLTREKLLSFKGRYYEPKNTVMIVAGNISALSAEKVKSLIEDNLSLKSDNQIEFLKPESSVFENHKISTTKKEIEQSHIVLGFKGVSYTDDDRYKLRMLSLVLGGSMSSRMFVKIREKMGLAYTVKTSASNYLDNGTIETYAGVEHGNVFSAIKAIFNEYNCVKNDLSETEIIRAKEIIDGRLLISMEDTNDLANYYAAAELMTGKITTPAEASKNYQSLSRHDIIEVSKKYLIPKNMALSYVGREIKGNVLENFLKELK